MHEFDRYDPKMFQKMVFAKDRIRVAGVGNSLSRTEGDNYRGDRELSTCEMQDVIDGAQRESWTAARRAATLQLNDLRGVLALAPISVDTTGSPGRPGPYCRAVASFRWLLPAEAKAQTPASRDSVAPGQIRELNQPARQVLATGVAPTPRWAEAQALRDRVHGADLRAANYLVEVYKKHAIAASCLVFVLIGVPAALRFPRGGVGLVIGLSLVVFTIYYVGLIAGEALGNRKIIPAFWAMWAPNVVFSVIGLALLWRTRRGTAPVRGGDWGDLRDALVAVVTRPFRRPR